jgi:hypothetical protein
VHQSFARESNVMRLLLKEERATTRRFVSADFFVEVPYFRRLQPEIEADRDDEGTE